MVIDPMMISDSSLVRWSSCKERIQIDSLIYLIDTNLKKY